MSECITSASKNDVCVLLHYANGCKYIVPQSINQPFTRNVTGKLLLCLLGLQSADAVALILHIIQQNCQLSIGVCIPLKVSALFTHFGYEEYFDRNLRFVNIWLQFIIKAAII